MKQKVQVPICPNRCKADNHNYSTIVTHFKDSARCEWYVNVKTSHVKHTRKFFSAVANISCTLLLTLALNNVCGRSLIWTESQQTESKWAIHDNGSYHQKLLFTHPSAISGERKTTNKHLLSGMIGKSPLL